MGDVRMETARGTYSKKSGPNLQLWEKELVESPEIKRKATVAQLCGYCLDRHSNHYSLNLSDFLDYYFQTLGYIAGRKERKARFDADTRSRNVSVPHFFRRNMANTYSAIF